MEAVYGTRTVPYVLMIVIDTTVLGMVYCSSLQDVGQIVEDDGDLRVKGVAVVEI